MAEIINETEQEIFVDDLPVEEDEELTEEDLINLFGVIPDEGDTAPVTHGWEESV